MTLDMGTLRELAAEFGFWPATTHPEDIQRHREHNRNADRFAHHYHSPCPRCGRPTRFKQWPTRCACSDAQRQKVRVAPAPHVVEISTEQEALDAAREWPDGPPLRIADRYAAGRPRCRPEESATAQDDS